MPIITDFQTLKAAIGGYSHRTGSSDVENVYDLLVQATTIQINRRLRCRQMEKLVTLNSANGIYTLPVDFLEMRSIYTGDRIPVDLVSPNQSLSPYLSLRREYYIVNNNLYYLVNGNLSDESVDLEITYYGALNHLVNDTDTNDILTAYPTLYLHGSMYEYAKYAEDEGVAMWATMFAAEVDEINQESDKAKYSGSPMRMRTF